MQELNQAELDCLKSIAKPQPGELPACAEHILQRLVASGLVERIATILLPLEMRRYSYRLTSAGRDVLSKCLSR